jgi:hypothetical protein
MGRWWAHYDRGMRHGCRFRSDGPRCHPYEVRVGPLFLFQTFDHVSDHISLGTSDSL